MSLKNDSLILLIILMVVNDPLKGLKRINLLPHQGFLELSSMV